MEGVVRTVLSGDRIEELPAEILGVMENALGPGQSLILARLKGERAEFAGVASGMSGSPVYVEGRLVGALAYRIGQFTKEAIGGITPIEYMIDVGRSASSSPGSPEGAARQASAPASPLRGVPLAAAPGARGESGALLRPIETPLVVAGLPPQVLAHFVPQFEALGAVAVAGSGGAASDVEPRSDPVRPGDAIAAQLVRGDLSVAATGTVTHVEGDRILAFGHPFLVSGPAEFSMARAEIYTTLASLAGSTKLARVMEGVGTWEQIRLAGAAGVTSRLPEMIPLTVNVTTPGRERTYRYEVALHRDWTPLLTGISIASSLVNTVAFTDESTIAVKGRIDLEGHPDIRLDDLYSGLGGATSAAIATASDVQAIFTAIFQNRFEEPTVRAIEITTEGIEESRLAFVEGVWPSRKEASPGDEVQFQVRLRSFRGDVETRSLTFRVPENAPRGTLRVVVGGGSYLTTTERGMLVRRLSGARSLSQIISIVNRLRRADELCAKAIRRLPGAVVQSEVMPALPPSVLTTLRANRGSRQVSTMAEDTVWEESVPMDSIVIGGAVLTLKIR
jgi:hypothetical protein